MLFSFLVPHSEENALQITHCISFYAHVHIVPLPDFRQSGDVIVGDVHATSISYFSINYYNLPVVTVHGMIDPREGNRVEFHDFNTSVTDCFQMMLFQWFAIRPVTESVEESTDFHTFLHFYSK